jgi:chromosome segregation ATPase
VITCLPSPAVCSPAAIPVAVALALGGAACASDGVADDDLGSLRSELERSHEERDELAGRVESLEQELAGLAAGGDDDPFVELDATVGELEDRLEALEGSATTDAAARAAAEDAADAAAADLRVTLDEVRSSTEAVRGEVEELRVLYETLRNRLDRQQR